MNLLQYVDLLPMYGSAQEPGFQRKISSQEEFASLPSNVSEKPPPRGEFYNHQVFTHRFLEHYDALVVLSEPGTGKTCEIAGFLEEVLKASKRREVPINEEQLSHFKHVYIAVRNDTQQQELYNQLICKCSDGHYLQGAIASARDEKQQRSIVKKVLKDAGYVIKTYNGLAKKVHLLTYDPETARYSIPLEDDNVLKQTREIFNDTVVWIDEAHNLISELEPDTTPKKDEKITLTKDRTYQLIWYLLHAALRTKRILSTATPMINQVSEIGRLLNLVLPIDGVLPRRYDHTIISSEEQRVLFPGLADVPQREFRAMTAVAVAPYFQGQFPDVYNYDKATLEDLEPRLRGLINYVRAANTGAIPTYLGPKLAASHEISGEVLESRLVLYPAVMSEHQMEAYLRAESQDKGTFSLDLRQASNFVFPDGNWGGGVNTIVDIGGMGQTKRLRGGGFAEYFHERRPTSAFLEELGIGLADDEVYQRISKFSTKYANICFHALHSPGIAFVFDEYVEGSGLEVLAACLQAFGFQRFEEHTSIFVGSNNETRPYCAPRERQAGRRIRENFKGRQDRMKPRFAVLTQHTVHEAQVMLEAINSYENRHGDYIKVLLCSRVGREGLSISNVQQIHLVGSSWNQSNNHQAISRGLRATSHIDLIEEKRKELEAEGRDEPPVIEVLMFNHVSLPNQSNATPESAVLSRRDYEIEGKPVIDVHMFLEAEAKDISNKRMMRKLKQLSIGCNVHHDRNIRASDIDGSASCDYDVCDYPCFEDASLAIDTRNFDLLYADKLVEEAKLAILEFLHDRNSFTFDELEMVIQQYKALYLMRALEDLVSSRQEIIDRFGYVTFLLEDEGSFYLSRDYPHGSGKREMSYYSQGLIAIEQKGLEELLREMEVQEEENIIQELEAIDPRSSDFSERLHHSSNVSQVKVLEDAIIRRVNGEKSVYVDRIIDHFYHWMNFRFYRPQREIDAAILHAGEKRQGRPKTKAVKVKNKTFRNQGTEVGQDPRNPVVYIHRLVGQGAGRTEYGAMAAFNKASGSLRILETDDLGVGWRNIDNDQERLIYNELMQVEVVRRKEPLEAKRIYGIVSYVGTFRIRDAERDRTEKQDARDIFSGSICANRSAKELNYLCWRLGFYPPDVRERVTDPDELEYRYENSKTYRDMFENKEDFESDPRRASLYYAWSESKYGRRVRCEPLLHFLRERGSLLEEFPW